MNGDQKVSAMNLAKQMHDVEMHLAVCHAVLSAHENGDEKMWDAWREKTMQRLVDLRTYVRSDVPESVLSVLSGTPLGDKIAWRLHLLQQGTFGLEESRDAVQFARNVRDDLLKAVVSSEALAR